MTDVIIQHKKVIYKDATKSFFMKGRDVQFDTSYKLINQQSGRSVEFHFDHSTGSEWDPTTLWIYKTIDNKYQLTVGNDDVTPAHAQAYLEAKLRNANVKDNSHYPGGVHPNNLGGDGYAMLYMQDGIED